MARERKKAKKAAHQTSLAWTLKGRLRRINVVTGNEPALGVNMFSMIIDDANYGSKTDVSKVNKSLNAKIREDKPAMLIIAEKSMSRREIVNKLTESAKRLIRECEGAVDKKALVELLEGICDQHHWSDYQRRKTIDQIATKLARSYFVYRVQRAARAVTP